MAIIAHRSIVAGFGLVPDALTGRKSSAVVSHRNFAWKKMTYIMKFRDRAEAGLWLAKKLRKYANRKDVLILALPRGGVPVGFEIANAPALSSHC